MMAQLCRIESENKQLIIPRLRTANTMWKRMKGLLGTRELPPDEALWIRPCNSIHTIFMNYAIDVAFVDRKLRICAVALDVQPWRMLFPVSKANSVVEMASGSIRRLNLKVGDQLHVDP